MKGIYKSNIQQLCVLCAFAPLREILAFFDFDYLLRLCVKKFGDNYGNN